MLSCGFCSSAEILQGEASGQGSPDPQWVPDFCAFGSYCLNCLLPAGVGPVDSRANHFRESVPYGPQQNTFAGQLGALQTAVRAAEGQKPEKLKQETQHNDDSPPTPDCKGTRNPTAR